MIGIELEAVVRLAALHQAAQERQRRRDIQLYRGREHGLPRERAVPLPAVRRGRAAIRV